MENAKYMKVKMYLLISAWKEMSKWTHKVKGKLNFGLNMIQKVCGRRFVCMKIRDSKQHIVTDIKANRKEK